MLPPLLEHQHPWFPDPENRPLKENNQCSNGHSKSDLFEFEEGCQKLGLCHRRGHLCHEDNIYGIVSCRVCIAEEPTIKWKNTLSCAVCMHVAYKRAGYACYRCENPVVLFNPAIRPHMDSQVLAELLNDTMGVSRDRDIELIKRSVKKYGHLACIAAYHRVIYITDSGGMLTANGIRFRQALGLWWAILKRNL